jgi:ATP-dependent DNA helicase RecQ
VDALLAECELATGADARYDHFLARTRQSVEMLSGPHPQWNARRVVEDLALALQGSLLLRHAPPEVADAFCASRLGDGGWASVVQAGLREGRFSDELLDAVDRLVRAWSPPVRYIAAVPSASRPGVVDDLARRLSQTLGIPHLALLERAEPRPPQREMANAALQAANVRGAFRVTTDPPPESCLLLDDLRLSGWTLAMVGGQLRRRGAGPVFPLVLATAF